MKTKKEPASNLPVRRRRILGRLLLSLQSGGYWCDDCEHETERVEGEQGQPAHCQRCQSHRIEYQPPIARKEYGQTILDTSHH